MPPRDAPAFRRQPEAATKATVVPPRSPPARAAGRPRREALLREGDQENHDGGPALEDGARKAPVAKAVNGALDSSDIRIRSPSIRPTSPAAPART